MVNYNKKNTHTHAVYNYWLGKQMSVVRKTNLTNTMTYVHLQLLLYRKFEFPFFDSILYFNFRFCFVFYCIFFTSVVQQDRLSSRLDYFILYLMNIIDFDSILLILLIWLVGKKNELIIWICFWFICNWFWLTLSFDFCWHNYEWKMKCT